MYGSKEEIKELIDNKIADSEKKFGKEFKFALLEILNLEKMLNPIEAQEKQSRLIPLASWNKFHDYPTVGALRQYYNRREANGFEDVVEYGGENGSRILIVEDKFFVWQKNRKKLATR